MQIYAAGVNGYRMNPIWKNQKQDKQYVYNIFDNDIDLHDTDKEVLFKFITLLLVDNNIEFL